MMFTNLIESQSHRKEFKRRGSFFLFTVAVYAVILFGVGIGGIYAYDARLEAQAGDLEILNWVPAVAPAKPDRVQTVKHTTPATSNSHNSPQPVRPVLYDNPANPTKTPEGVSTTPQPIPPAPPGTIIGKYVSDPVGPPATNACPSCNGTGDPAPVETHTLPPAPLPQPPVAKPTTIRVPSTILTGKALSLPQPPYPLIAKEARVQGPVSIQILVSEEGKVLSAQAVSGNGMLTSAAKEAAMRARFSPTILNGEPVKIQGVITYNFTLR